MATEEHLIKNDRETLLHIKAVNANTTLFAMKMLERGLVHDDTKMESPEREIFAENVDRLGKVEYASAEYKQMMNEVRPAIDHHYSKNRHHPEFWPNGIEGMTLIDLCEMLADWKAATARNKNGNIRKSIEVNAEKFGISPQLRKILENTVRELFEN
jgi:hypothetical protein